MHSLAVSDWCWGRPSVCKSYPSELKDRGEITFLTCNCVPESLKDKGKKTSLTSYREWYFLFVCTEEQMFIIMDVEEFLSPLEYLV